MTEITTDRLYLRPFQLTDLDWLAAIWADPDVMRYVGTSGPRSREKAQKRLGELIEHQQQHGFSIWAVLLQDGQTPIGYCGIQYLDDTPQIEVGYGFAKACWGKGYATESAAASVRYGFETVGLDRIVAIVHPENRASNKVIQKVGMHYEGIQRYYGVDCCYYTLNRDQWKALNSGSAV